MHARYYDATLGVFLSPDPAEADANTYRYAWGDPISWSDRSGLMAGCHSGGPGGGFSPYTNPAGNHPNMPHFSESVTVTAPGPATSETDCSVFNNGPLDRFERIELGLGDPLDRVRRSYPDATVGDDNGTDGDNTGDNTGGENSNSTGSNQPSGIPGGIGVQIGGLAEAGYGSAAVSGQVSGGTVVTLQGAGGFINRGLFVGPMFNAFARNRTNSFGLVAGRSAGVSLQIFGTNARRPSDLAGPFNTLSISVGSLSVQWSRDPRTGTFTIGGGISRGTPGISVSYYETSTRTGGLCWVGNLFC